MQLFIFFIFLTAVITRRGKHVGPHLLKFCMLNFHSAPDLNAEADQSPFILY